MKRINCFIPFSPDPEQTAETLRELRACEAVNTIYLLSTDPEAQPIDGTTLLSVTGLNASATLRTIARCSDTDFTLLYTPCVAAISAVKRELGSGWKAAGVALSQCAIAWAVAFAVCRIAVLILE